ncbi:MAG: hypothetical protein JXB10_06325 [Pirellulales bacterium]|nr:hypothetical protein [Pirellulales bacterium]
MIRGLIAEPSPLDITPMSLPWIEQFLTVIRFAWLIRTSVPLCDWLCAPINSNPPSVQPSVPRLN